ncbi:peptidase inhibitor family I36 protein [Longimycelium tulufanense]|uniref:peptidase inhibitor family I36 protein n=1 Tax=Longimycelium tulufanense TaxID=907463 RepID=UPI003571798B
MELSCTPGWVCLWEHPNGTGARISWRPSEGNVFIGDKNRRLVDHVSSFIVNTGDGVCLQDSTIPQERRRYRIGEERTNYYLEFGNRVDRIRPHDECV